jgi:HD-like signal output (HDOD) protein
MADLLPTGAALDDPLPPAVAEAALDDLAPAPPSPEEEAAARREAKLAQILDRMTRHADFPSLKDAIRGIQKVSRSDLAHQRALTDEVLQDVALTNKLLRLINTAYYSSVGGGHITTVSRAVALMGFQSVGMLAASLALFERLPKHADSARVREEFACALMAALIANELLPSRKLQESAYITALFQNLGVMLAWLHLADEVREVEGRLLELCPQAADVAFGPSPLQRIDPADVERISGEVLGVGFQDLGIEIAQQWGWPADMIHALRPLPIPAEEQHIPPHDQLRGVCTAANRLAREIFGCSVDERAERLERFLAEWGFSLHLDSEKLDGVLERTLAEWAELAPVMSLPRPELLSATLGPAAAPSKAAAPAGRGRPVTATPQRPVAGKAAQPPLANKAPAPAARQAPPAHPQAIQRPAAAHPPATVPARPDDPQRIAQLTAGIEKLSLAALSDATVTQMMQTFMQVLGEALRLRRVLICLRARNPDRLEGRMGSSAEAQRIAPAFRIPLQPPADLFALLCQKGSDSLISDSSDPLIAERLPAWFREQVRASCFLVLPVLRAGQVVGMVYADTPPAGQALQVTERELALIKSLRNQVLLALQLREGAASARP